jgi:putative hemolysin
MLYQLGYIPKIGERLEWNGWKFEVVDMDGNRIDRLLVVPGVPADARERQDGGAADTSRA